MQCKRSVYCDTHFFQCIYTTALCYTHKKTASLRALRMCPMLVGKEDAGKQDASIEMKLADYCSQCVIGPSWCSVWIYAWHFFFSITLILRQSQREKYLHLEYKVIRVFVPCTQLKRAPTPCRISCCVIPHCYAAATLPLVPTPRLFQCYEQRGQSS